MVPSPAEDEAVAANASQWVVFACGGHWYGLPLEHSREILTPRSMTRLPGCGPEVCGLVGLRGRVHTVFDLGIVLGGRSALENPDYRLIVLALGDRRVAVVVDDVITVSREGTEIVPVSDDASYPDNVDRAAIVGAATFDHQTFLVVDPEQILGRLLT